MRATATWPGLQLLSPVKTGKNACWYGREPDRMAEIDRDLEHSPVEKTTVLLLLLLQIPRAVEHCKRR